MATQTVEFRSPPSQTVTAKLFTVGSDAEQASVSATEATNRKGTYSASFIDEAAGEYELIAFVGSVPVARWFVTLTLTTATFQTYDKARAELDTAGRLAIWNVLSTESFTADSMGARLLISDGTNGRQVKVTGAKHVAADVHECQADGLTDSTEITAINTFATRVTTGLVSDGPVWQFTANMLELAPSATGVDELIALQEEILAAVNAYIAGIAASASLSPGTIVGFPATLNIGDSYTDDCNSAIHVFIRDSNDDPITAVGTHEFTDVDFAPECIITLNGNTGRVKCAVEYVAASPENYLKIQIPSKESRRATPGIATVQVLLKWDGAQKALSKQAVTWEALI